MSYKINLPSFLLFLQQYNAKSIKKSGIVKIYQILLFALGINGRIRLYWIACARKPDLPHVICMMAADWYMACKWEASSSPPPPRRTAPPGWLVGARWRTERRVSKGIWRSRAAPRRVISIYDMLIPSYEFRDIPRDPTDGGESLVRKTSASGARRKQSLIWRNADRCHPISPRCHFLFPSKTKSRENRRRRMYISINWEFQSTQAMRVWSIS